MNAMDKGYIVNSYRSNVRKFLAMIRQVNMDPRKKITLERDFLSMFVKQNMGSYLGRS